MEKKRKKFLDRPYFSWVTVSLITYLALECINQRSFVELCRYIVLRPYSFILNLAIVMLSYSVALFVKRRLFSFTVTGLLWTVMGVINLIVLVQRNTQFNCSDIFIFKYGILISPRYLSVIHYILIAVGIVGAVVATVILHKKGYLSRSENSKRHSSVAVGVLAVVILTMGIVGNVTGLLMPRFTNINQGYKNNGFIYAFFCSVAEIGVDEPENYTEGSVEAIISDFKENSAGKLKPNVIFVQLESFIDPKEFVGIEFASDPVPNFTRLKESCPSGHLNVSVLGGGTANTEFEILTGMNINDFGTIELPYESFLDSNTCETMAYNCKALGYKTHAIHNFSAGFYMRNKVFANMGFDTFTSFEYMTDVEYNPIGWAKDMIMERYIRLALDSTPERDFIQAITVQGHGSYPTDFDDSERDAATTYSSSDIEDYRSQIDYYVSQISEMDEFIGSLTDSLKDFEEPTVIAFYGDHLPGISLTEDMLETGSLYKTEYVIWSNFDIEAPDRDLCTYQLAAYVQTLAGHSSGQITKLHQTYMDTPEYEEYLKVLEYDIIEGDMLTYGSENPFEPSELEFGVEDILITDITYVDKSLYVTGENFNEHSSVYINGNRKNTEYINSTTLLVKGVRVREGDKIAVAQMSYQMPWTYLSKTEEYEY
ncbi:MAG: LTA synthase family protein [Clostridia bacterium]|nr:LTA synthase family protein [Clostridia bacterium]